MELLAGEWGYLASQLLLIAKEFHDKGIALRRSKIRTHNHSSISRNEILTNVQIRDSLPRLFILGQPEAVLCPGRSVRATNAVDNPIETADSCNKRRTKRVH